MGSRAGEVVLLYCGYLRCFNSILAEASTTFWLRQEVTRPRVMKISSMTDRLYAKIM